MTILSLLPAQVTAVSRMVVMRSARRAPMP